VSWSARIAHTSTGLAIVFAGPVSRLDFTPDVAAHFARLLAAEASSTIVGSTLEAENGSRAVAVGGDAAENKQNRVTVGMHPLFCDCLNGDAP
jgi:hypothetical protein